jgi:hypothetical protein
MIKTYKVITAVFVLATISFAGCKSNDRWNPDVSKIQVNVKFIRFEKLLYGIDTAHFEEGFRKLTSEHPMMMELYMMRLHHFRIDNPKAIQFFKRKYIADRYMHDSLYPDVEKVFSNEVIAGLENQFSDAFRHVKYYYPADTVPKMYTFINPWDVPSATYPNILAVGLDMFLGENYRYYPTLEYPEYLRKRLRKEYILPEALKTWFQNKYDIQKQVDPSLLSNMIFLGKRLFYLDMMKPDLADTLKIGYTTRQLKWCKDNEGDIWDQLVVNNLLFNTNADKVGRYINDGPFTNDADNFPQESAPRLGEWVGWQIVKKYMEENPKVTPDELFKEKDYRKILTLSKYKPKK